MTTRQPTTDHRRADDATREARGAAQQQNQAMTTAPPDPLAAYKGATRSLRRANELLDWAANSGEVHLVSPATSIGYIAEGFSLVLSVVWVDTREMREGGEVYDVQGKLALGKSALDRIAMAADVAWDPVLSGRVDDRSDRAYACYRAVAMVPTFDGNVLPRIAEREFDVRDGSPRIAGQKPKAISEMRKFCAAHAQSRAMCAAVRSLGIRSAYVRPDVEKAFVVAKLALTYQTDDPTLRQAFALAAIERAQRPRVLMFGSGAASMPAPQAVVQTGVSGFRPPPVGSDTPDDDDDDVRAPPHAPAAPTAGRYGRPQEPLCGCGPHDGRPVRQLTDKELIEYMAEITRCRADPALEAYAAQMAADFDIASKVRLERMNAAKPPSKPKANEPPEVDGEPVAAGARPRRNPDNPDSY